MKKYLLLLLCILQTCSIFGQYSISASQYDSMRQLLPKAKENAAKVDLLFNLAVGSQYSYTQAVRYYNEALQLARKLDDKQKILGCLVSIGLFYADKGEPVKSIVLLQEALLYAEELKEDPSMSLAFIANGYEAQGDLKNAMDYTRKAFLIYENRLKNKLPADPRGYPAGPMRMGQLYEKMGQLDSAMYYAQLSYQRILEKPLEGGWLYFYCTICNLLGTVHRRQNNPTESIRFYRLALQKGIEIDYASSIQESKLGLAKFYFQTGQPDSVIHYATQTYAGANTIRSFAFMQESAFLLRSVYEQQGMYAKALYYNDFAIAARDSVSGAEKVREVQNLTFKEEQRQQKMLQEIEAKRIAYQNRVKMYSLLAVLGAVLLLAFILYRNNQQKQRANALLQAQKEEINSQKTQLQSSLETLKATQNQLIQSEKLASLGELTAGIAHEIQNPLNFVNNFSELSVELAEELKEEINKPELDKGLIEELVSDLALNQEKINHHGQRASSIVKGMLEHSRSSSGVKEPTNLNALADEYLRLAYHGLRAKDSSFNATMETHFEPDLPMVSVIPQDIGRVLLNLINNAFYAVAERSRSAVAERSRSAVAERSRSIVTAPLAGAQPYGPTVTVTTKKLDNAIEITVKDNGNGIPEAIKDKIFQPFFTTKPTGQGTGLGLSLAYDIVVKGHNGNLNVHSIKAEGSEFIINLPL